MQYVLYAPVFGWVYGWIEVDTVECFVDLAVWTCR